MRFTTLSDWASKNDSVCVCGFAMVDSEDNKPKAMIETNQDRHLVLDGTANLDYAGDEPTPRVKGLIELINQYLRNKPDRNH